MSDWFDVAAGGLGAGASLFSTITNAKSVSETNAANAKIAAENRAFQERMSSTAHQREVADLTSAGLNPLLSVAGGSGSSTPSGSTATMQAKQYNVNEAVNSALSAFKNSQETKLLDATVKKVKADTANTNEQTTGIKYGNVIKGQEADVMNTWIGKNVLTPTKVAFSALAPLFSAITGGFGTAAKWKLAKSAAQNSNFKTGGVIGGDI